MKATLIQFRLGSRTYKPRHYLIAIDGIKTRKDTSKVLGKEVVWTSPAGRPIRGIIKAPHGNKGVVRAIFEKGLPGQAVTTKVDIKE